MKKQAVFLAKEQKWQEVPPGLRVYIVDPTLQWTSTPAEA